MPTRGCSAAFASSGSAFDSSSAAAHSQFSAATRRRLLGYAPGERNALSGAANGHRPVFLQAMMIVKEIAPSRSRWPGGVDLQRPLRGRELRDRDQVKTTLARAAYGEAETV